MVFYVGRLRPFRWSEVKHVSGWDDMRCASNGDVFDVLDHVFEWDDDCVSPDLCSRWRTEGDDVCDAALRHVFSHPSATVGKDLLQSLQDYASATVETGHPSPVDIFLNEVQQPPPPGLRASGEDIALAQELFLDDATQIMQALLHYSLAGGLASPRIVKTLEAVSYLVPHTDRFVSPLDSSEIGSCISQATSDRTFVRLVETMQFVLDVMACTSVPQHEPRHDDNGEHPSEASYLSPGGDGWKSALRVRLLHAVSRWRVEMRWKKEGCPNALDGVPVSQQELAATLASFSILPLWTLRRLHIAPNSRTASAYLALWRHVGFYMGVSPTILQRYFSNLQAADKFTVTVSLNLFFEEILPSPPPGSVPKTHQSNDPDHPTTASRGPTIPILVAVSGRAPLHTTLAYNIALTTHLLGTALATRVGLPPPSAQPRLARLKMHLALLAQRAPHAFARWYPRAAWREKRRAALREGLACTVRWYMGSRRSAFRPRTEVGGELAPGVKELEGVRGDPVRARALTRMWKEVFVEMVVVCVLIGVVGGVVAFLVTRWVAAVVLS